MTSVSQKVKVLGLICLCIIAVQPATSRAQESISFSVSPTIYDMTANPAQSWQSTVRIVNPNPFELTLSIELNNFVPKDEDGIPQFLPIQSGETERKTLAEWITTEREITIGAEQTFELPFRIDVPSDAAPGGHYAALMISTKPLESIEGSGQVQTSQVISSLIFLRVTGDVMESSTIRSFRTTDYFLSKPETRFELRIENKGNVHLQPQGEIKIYNMWGSERGIIPINQQTMLGNVLPQSVRKFSFEWVSEWSVTDIGRYTAVATLAYGSDQRQFITADTAFWIIPWKILLTLLVVVGSLVAAITWAIKLYVRHVLALAGVSPAAAQPAKVSVPAKPAKVSKKALNARAVAAPIGVSILDLRSRLHHTHGPWTQKLRVYVEFVKTYWKFFAGVAATLVLVVLVVWFVTGALSDERAYEVTDPASGDVIARNEAAEPPVMQNAQGMPIRLVNRTADTALLERVEKTATDVGFSITATTTEQGAPEEKTVIVYNPDASEQALLLSRALNNALLSAFTSTGSSTEKIVVYVGKDAVEGE